MGEPVTIYSTRSAPLTLDEVRRWSGPKVLSVTATEDRSSVQVRWPDCTITLHLREPEGGLEAHLDGLRGYIWTCGGGQMTSALYALIERTYFIRHSVGTVTEPALTTEAAGFLGRMAEAGCALIFAQQSVQSADGTPLLSPAGVEESQRPAYWPDAIERRTRTESYLALRGSPVPPSLPPVCGEPEAMLRSPAEVGLRALALAAVASRAVPKGLGRGAAKALVKDHPSALTPSEDEFLRSFFPGNATRVQFGWRFEALHTLLWALGWASDIGQPSAPTSAADILSSLDRAGSFPALPRATSLRPVREILDHYDLIYRCHWLTTEARVRGLPPPSWLDPGVVSERHHALHWLTCHRREDWDDVRTDT